MSAADDAYAAAEALIEQVRAEGGTVISLSGARFAALTRLPDDISTLSKLRYVDLTDTAVSDLAALTELASLRDLWISNSRVSDLRPLLPLEALFDPDRSFQTGLHFANTPASSASAELTRLAEISDDSKRNRETLAYLRTLPPWPAPLPWEVDDDAPEGPVPDAPEPPPLPFLTLTPDQRIDLRPLGMPDDVDPAIMARLYDRLRPAVGRLSRYANRCPDLAPIVESMNRSLGDDLAALDYLNLHLDFGELFDLRAGEPTGDDPWDRPARSAADAVLRTGPGLTVAHPEVAAHEKSLSAFQRRTTAPEAVSEQRLAQALADDAALATEPARALGKRLAVSGETGRTAEMRQAFVRKAILLVSTIGIGLAGAVEGAVYGEALNIMLPAAEFLWLHKNEVIAVAQGWGSQAALWADYILRAARHVIQRAKREDE